MNIFWLIVYAPFMALGVIHSQLPRSWFIKTYRPSSEFHRDLELKARNDLRLVRYNIIKRIAR